jgi:hypothetical protein|tara:strand:- start:2295 stop:2642 length:348 start_codon:yes stop_codon:yes gene_type:complete
MKGAFGGFILVLSLLQFVYSCSKDASVLEEQAPTQYTLTVTTSEGGFVTPDANGTYDAGAVITISATPNEGYMFDRFSGSDNDDSRCAFARYCRTGVKMNSNRDVQVFFKLSNSE